MTMHANRTKVDTLEPWEIREAELLVAKARADAAEAECKKWSDAADKARQPETFYEDYDEGTMRAMQALLSAAEARVKALEAMVDRMGVIAVESVSSTTKEYAADMNSIITLVQRALKEAQP